ncbi:hypothetical protein IB278_33135 [Variovorax sp. VRV01]|nr:hypothetical protein [Variovorax sp. VRV01]
MFIRTPSLLCLIAMSLVSGCAFHQQPYVTDEVSSVPLRETSVFSVDFERGYVGGPQAIQITHVDGKEMPAAQVGYPVWVRVLPGNHVFDTRQCTSVLSTPLIKTTCVKQRYTLDMQRLHVYAFNHQTREIRDLGERPNYAVALGVDGQKKYPVKFD